MGISPFAAGLSSVARCLFEPAFVCSSRPPAAAASARPRETLTPVRFRCIIPNVRYNNDGIVAAPHFNEVVLSPELVETNV